MAHHVENWVVPVGVTRIFARAYAGGASGSSGSNGGAFFGGGGGGGAFSAASFAVTPGNTLPIGWGDAPPTAVYPSSGSPGENADITIPGPFFALLALHGGPDGFPAETGGIGGDAAGGVGDFKQSGGHGDPGGFTAGPGGDGGVGAPPDGAPGGLGGNLANGSPGNIPSSGGGGAGSAAGPPSGGAGTPSGVRIWDDTSNTANGATNTPPSAAPIPIAEFGTGLPPFVPPTPSTKLRKSSYMM